MGFGRPRGGNGRGFRGGSGAGGGNFRSNSGGFNKGPRGGGRGAFDNGPPERVIQLGNFIYSCQNELVCKVGIQDVPYFNAPIYLENKEQIGKIDEIFGTVRDYSVSIKLSDNVFANSFKQNQALYIDPGKLLPIARFLPKPPQPKGIKRKIPQNRSSAFGQRVSTRGVTGLFSSNFNILSLNEYFIFKGGRGGGGRNNFGNNGFKGPGRGAFNRGRGNAGGNGRGRW
ncbi:hypothetical protein KR018_006905 [Drosophila ironensis]|nr:hypothetical protein KR018_006905 [Drosophila ironensis]